MKQLNFINFNNLGSKSIEWFIVILKVYFKKYKILIKKDFKLGNMNLFIEGFNDHQTKYLSKLLHSKNINILLLTEFIESNSLVTHKDKNIIIYFLIQIYKILRLDRLGIKKLIYSCINLFKIEGSINETDNVINHKKRFKNLKKIIYNFDFILTTHPVICTQVYKKFGIKSFFITPELNLIKKNKKKNLVKFSGLKTNYRKKIIYKIKYNEMKQLMENQSNSNIFLDVKNENYQYSFHPKKYKNWKFSSPIRYYYSIMKNQIPLTIDSFKDNLSNQLTIKIDLKDFSKIYLKLNYKKFFDKLNNKIVKYNLLAKKNNNIFFSELRRLDVK